MGRIRKDALDLEFLPETCKVQFIGPQRISCYSTYFDEKHEVVYCPDNSSLKYLVSTELDEPLKCAEGCNPESDECALSCRWSDFMHWIDKHEENIKGLTSQDDPKQQFDFICTNMELKYIMLSCFEASDWVIHAFRTRKEIFLYLAERNITKDKVESKPQYNPMKTNKMSYARLNVIRKITEAVEERATNSNTVTDILSTVSLSTIGQHRILHNGFTEFVMSKEDVDKPIDQANFSALKLMHNLYEGQNGGFNISFYRHLYWWASALVSGVERLICGDLDEDFTLRKLDVLPASLLNTKYHAAAQKKCLITLDKILHFIKSEVKEINMIYVFRLNAETKEVIVSPSEKSIEDYLPPWYVSGDTPDQAKS
uniref:Decapping nuclease n=1 Tax=Tetranychus urticae TaxID=32264 RepID=T1KE39_TETUR